MRKRLLLRVLGVLIWLIEEIFKVPPIQLPDLPCEPALVFTRIRFGETIIKGDLKEMKIEFGQGLRVLATLVGGVGIQAGSAQWSVIAQDAEGNDRSSDFSVTPNPDNELECTIRHSGTHESTGVVRLQVDGDRDADEDAIIVGTLDFVVDEPNVTAIELSATVVSDADGGDTGGGDTGGGDTGGGDTGGGDDTAGGGAGDGDTA